MPEKNNVPLSIVCGTGNTNFTSQIGIGSKLISQDAKHWAYWFVVLDRSSLDIVFNELHTKANTVPNLGQYNNSDHILVLATLGVGLNNQPQGDLFKFLDLNGAGQQLRRIDQVATQFNCGSLGTFGYGLVGVMGDQNMPGFEVSRITAPSSGPILTVQLAPFEVDGNVSYTPVSLSNA